MVPLGRLVDLFLRRDRLVETAGELVGRVAALVVALVVHLDFHPIERRVAPGGEADPAAAVAALAELPVEFQAEVTVLPVRDQPSAARLAAVEHTVFVDVPLRAVRPRLTHIVPGADRPPLGLALFREQDDGPASLVDGEGERNKQEREAENSGGAGGCSHSEIITA